MSHDQNEPCGDPVVDALTAAAAVLPDQGPMGVFIHHNTLHSFQSLPFHQGVARGAQLLGARPYPLMCAFRLWMHDGRIESTDLDHALARALARCGQVDEDLLLGMPRVQWWRLIWLHALDTQQPEDLARNLARNPTHHSCATIDVDLLEAVKQTPPSEIAPTPWQRHHDALFDHGVDTDVVVHGELIRLSGAFLDHGQALIDVPQRERGFLATALELLALGLPSRSLAQLSRSAQRWINTKASARQIIDEALNGLGVRDEQREPYIIATLLALPGWAGMFARMQRNPTEAPVLEDETQIPIRLEDFLAVRMAIELHAIPKVAAQVGLSADWSILRLTDRRPARSRQLAAALLLQSARQAAVELVITPESLRQAWTDLDLFNDEARRACGLEAYEHRYQRQILNALGYARAHRPAVSKVSPAGQFIFCIDEREESIRRAIEEQGPKWVTYGAAGFFGMAIDYRGLEDFEAAPYCPVVVTPAHEVHESANDDAIVHERRRTRMGAWKRMESAIARSSRGLIGGAGVSLLVGPIASLFSVARLALPRDSAAALHSVQEFVAPKPDTELGAIRSGTNVAKSGKPMGFTIDEAADRLAGLLKTIGLVKDFAPVVVVLGHGSTSLNNPHESAHDCGACGGRRGGANARLVADLVNRAEVRHALRARGIDIPESTWFVGGLHDTADDRVDIADLDQMPQPIAPAWKQVRLVLESARRANALERARRFEALPLNATPEQALAHVQERSTHLGQPRPEYGHCTNACCIVGRRDISRGLHLDRRAFLVSYDASIDKDAGILERVLAAVGPVGAGISLEYYFSSVDNQVFGCGTKLPHNVTGLIGIMNGHQSDLRTGLPLQMVEIHEPMRLLIVVEATTDALLQVAGRQAEVRELVVNEWVQLVSIDPTTGSMHVWSDGGFKPFQPDAVELDRFQYSPQRNRAGREHLAPAWIEKGLS